MSIQSTDQPTGADSRDPNLLRSRLRRAAEILLFCAFLIVLLRLAAFDVAVWLADALSAGGSISVEGRRKLSVLLIGGAVVLGVIGAFLATLCNARWRNFVDAVFRSDALRVRGLSTPSAYRLLTWSASLGLLVIALWILRGRLGAVVQSLFNKEGFFETVTFVLELAAAALCAMAARHWRHRDERFGRAVPVLYAACAAALFVVGMEEINWGQTLFGFETPSSWAQINHQSETSIHNLVDREGLTRTAKAAAVLFGIAAAALSVCGALAPRSIIGAVAPPASLAPLAIIIGVGGVYLHPEIIELLLALYVTFYSYRIYIAARSSDARRAGEPLPWRAGLRAVFTITIIAALLGSLDWSQASRELAKLSAWALAGILGLMVLGLLVSAWKWLASLRMHELKYPFSYLLRIYAAGFFFNTFLPTAIGGDAYRVFRTLPRESYRSRALSAVAVERAMGFLVLLCLGGLGALALADRFDAARVYCGALLAASAAGALGFIALERGWLRGLAGRWRAIQVVDAARHTLGLLHGKRREWLALAAGSLVFQAISIGVIYLLFALLGSDASIAQCALIAAVVGVSATLPISINGLGVMEGAFVAMAAMLGMDYDNALLVAFTRRFVALLLAALCGIVYALDAHRRGAVARPGARALMRAFREGGSRAVLEAIAPMHSDEAAERAVPLAHSRHRRRERQPWWSTELLEYTHDAIIIWEMEGAGILYWNRSAERLYGYRRHEAIGRVTHELLKTRLADGIGHLEKTVARFGIWIGELQHCARNGRQVVVDARLALLAQRNGRWLVLEVNRDITDLKVAEAERVAVERQLSQLRVLHRP